MMCLGWFNQMDCQARPYVTVAGPTQTAADVAGMNNGTSGTSGAPCTTPWWFWVVGAGVVAMGVVKK